MDCCHHHLGLQVGLVMVSHRLVEVELGLGTAILHQVKAMFHLLPHQQVLVLVPVPE